MVGGNVRALNLFSWKMHKCHVDEGLGSGALIPPWWEYKMAVSFGEHFGDFL